MTKSGIGIYVYDRWNKETGSMIWRSVQDADLDEAGTQDR